MSNRNKALIGGAALIALIGLGSVISKAKAAPSNGNGDRPPPGEEEDPAAKVTLEVEVLNKTSLGYEVYNQAGTISLKFSGSVKVLRGIPSPTIEVSVVNLNAGSITLGTQNIGEVAKGLTKSYEVIVSVPEGNYAFQTQITLTNVLGVDSSISNIVNRTFEAPAGEVTIGV